MSRKPQSKDEALEALDFIVNVLKEHEKDLDRLISELGTVTEQLGEAGEISGKVEKVEQRITGLQNEITGLINYLSTSPHEAPIVPKEPMVPKEERSEITLSQPLAAPVVQADVVRGPPVILRCKQWEDFLALAFQAQTLSFMYKEAEKSFQADALKGNQVITFSGELPKVPVLLKMWLCRQLDVPEKRVLEGVLAIG